MAFGGGKFQCPGRSVRQLDCMDAESIQKDSGPGGGGGGGGESVTPNLGAHIWFVWAVAGWGVCGNVCGDF